MQFSKMLFPATIFISAFLLFQIQPILAKIALPYFGGGAAIWTTCMLFFQFFLLVGYLYSHCLIKLKNIKHQIITHSLLIGCSLFFLPLTPVVGDAELGTQSPQSGIILLLLKTVGLPYLVLSSTAPLIQKWHSYLFDSNQTYRLYSLSNLGSLIALISFPFLIEPIFTTNTQTAIWSVGYVLFAGFVLLSGRKLYSAKSISNHVIDDDGQRKPVLLPASMFLWLALSATSVVLMVATTSAMTQNISPTPFLWILPLCIYLLTYIICFNRDWFYVRKIWFVLFVASSVASLLMFYVGIQFTVLTQIGIYSFILLCACMLCHGELARLKPSTNQLTLFYLTSAIGGVIGSIFTSIIAERLFNHYYEFPLAIAAVYVLFVLVLIRENASRLLSKGQQRTNVYFSFASVCGVLLFGLYFSKLNNMYFKEDIFNSRNFYGTLAVKDFMDVEEPMRMLFDGTTSHGTQYLNPAKRNIPTSYYRKGTGIHLALKEFDTNKPKKVAVIGLGTGSIAAFGQSGDEYIFYELNQNVELAANEYFTYLSSAKAKVSVELGDARITLQNQLQQSGNQEFDVLVVDAFSSDSIPVHLLTVEAFQLYQNHLKEDGLLVLHISNNNLDLLPLVSALSKQADKALYHFYAASNDASEHSAEWTVLTNNNEFANSDIVKKYASYLQIEENEHVLWTDSYSNLLSVIKF